MTRDSEAVAPQTAPIYFDTVVGEGVSEGRASQARNYGFVVGLDPFGKPLTATLTDSMYPHMLVAGTTAAGKSVFLHTLLAQVLLNASPRDLRVLFLDAGLQTQMFYREVPHLWRPLSDSREAMVDTLKEAVGEMEHRRQLWNEAGAVDRESYLKLRPQEEIPVLFIVIDEGASFSNNRALKDAYLESLTALLRLGRKYGIHVLVELQRPMADTLGLAMKELLSQRFVFRLESSAQSENVLNGDSSAAGLRGFGDGLYRRGAEVSRFQALYLPEQGQETNGHLTLPAAVAKIIARWR
jgi:S-DNA-T family DNA segregation ATPase FtsK/SpoIIIE